MGVEEFVKGFAVLSVNLKNVFSFLLSPVKGAVKWTGVDDIDSQVVFCVVFASCVGEAPREANIGSQRPSDLSSGQRMYVGWFSKDEGASEGKSFQSNGL